MSTSAADPARLAAYPGQLVDVDDQLTTPANDVDDALEAFVTGAGGYAPGFDANGAGDLVRGLRDESYHLGGWVASVGAAFAEASALGITQAEIDNFISRQVGEPTIAEAQHEAAGAQAAAELREELSGLGLDPDSFDPYQIAELDPFDERYQRVYELMAEIGGDMSNEDFAMGFYDRMNVDGIRTVFGLIDNTAAQPAIYGRDDLEWIGSVQDQVLDPFVAGWAIASGSIDLTGERRGLLATENPVEQQVLTRLMSGDPARYDPGWLADAAERILVTGADLNVSTLPAPGQPGFIAAGWFYDEPALGSPELVALRALDGNVEAAWRFVGRGQDHVDVLVRPPGLPGGVPLDIDDYEQLAAQFEIHAAGALEAGFLEAPYTTVVDPDDPSRRIHLVDPDASIQAYDDLILSVGEGDVPDVIRRSVALTLQPHLNEIGEVAAHEAVTPEDEVDGPFRRPDLVAFFEELGHDPDAAQLVGQQLGMWGVAEVQYAIDQNPDLTPRELETTLNPLVHVLGAASNGFDATEAAIDEANAGLAFGLDQSTAVLTRLGPAAIPLLAAGPLPAGVTFTATGGAAALSTLGAVLTGNLTEEPADIPYDAETIRRDLPDLLRSAAVEHLMDVGAIPRTTPPSRWGEELAAYFDADGDPFNQLSERAIDQAFNHGADDPW
ncbi:MAG: hypothetical protein ACRD0A_06960 [Acidimicrobiales bacterium]